MTERMGACYTYELQFSFKLGPKVHLRIIRVYYNGTEMVQVTPLRRTQASSP